MQRLYEQAHVDQQAGRPERAVADYRELIRLDSSIAPAYNNLGRLLYNQNEFSEAADVLRKGLAIDPGMAPAQVMLGASYLELGKPAEALAPLRAGVQALPGDRFARMSLARAEMALHQTAEALGQLDALVQADPKDQEAWYLAGKLHLQMSQDAFVRVQSIDPNTALAHVMEGEIMESMQNTPGAVAAYKQAIAAARPALAPIGTGSSDGRAVGGRAVDGAAAGGEDAGPLQHLAKLYWSTGDWAHAREQYLVLLERQPKDCVSRWRLAKAMDELGEPPEAGLRELNAALAQCPDLPEAHAERAKLLLRSDAQGGLRGGPGEGAARTPVAPGEAATPQAGRARAALDDLLLAEKAAPDEPSVQQLLARCYRVLGEPAKADAANRKFTQLQQQLHQAAERHANSVVRANE